MMETAMPIQLSCDVHLALPRTNHPLKKDSHHE